MRIVFYVKICLLISLNTFAQEQSTSLFDRPFYASISMGKAFLINYKQYPKDIPGVVATNSVYSGADNLNVKVGYSIKKFEFELIYELATYKVAGGKTILTRPGHEFDFNSSYPQFYVTPVFNDPLQNKYYQHSILMGAGYKIVDRKMVIKPNFQIGVSIVKPPSDKVFMKQKISNYTQEVTFNGKPSYNLNLRGGISLRYKVVRYLSLCLDYEYLVSRPKIIYKVTTEDVFSKTLVKQINGANTIMSHNISLGVFLNFKEI